MLLIWLSTILQDMQDQHGEQRHYTLSIVSWADCGLEEAAANCNCASKARKSSVNTHICCYNWSSQRFPYFKLANALVRVKHLRPTIHSTSWELHSLPLEYTAKRPHASYFKYKSTQAATITFNNILIEPHLNILRHRWSKKFKESKVNSINKNLKTESTVKKL